MNLSDPPFPIPTHCELFSEIRSITDGRFMGHMVETPDRTVWLSYESGLDEFDSYTLKKYRRWISFAARCAWLDCPDYLPLKQFAAENAEKCRQWGEAI